MKQITKDEHKYTIIQYSIGGEIKIYKEIQLHEIYNMLPKDDRYIYRIKTQVFKHDNYKGGVEEVYTNFQISKTDYSRKTDEETYTYMATNMAGKTVYITGKETDIKTKKLIFGSTEENTPIKIVSYKNGVLLQIKQQSLIDYLNTHDYTKYYVQQGQNIYSNIVKDDTDEYTLTSTNNKKVKAYYVDDIERVI